MISYRMELKKMIRSDIRKTDVMIVHHNAFGQLLDDDRSFYGYSTKMYVSQPSYGGNLWGSHDDLAG